MKRTNSATKLQAQVRGRQVRQQQSRLREARVKRTNSATKLQAQVRGRQVRQTVGKKRGKSSSRYAVVEASHDDDDNDPEIVAARVKVKQLRIEYRQYREQGNKGKLQMALLDYDVAVSHLHGLEIRQMKKNKQTSQSAKCCLVACLPCMLLFQFFCCVSTASTGEYSKKQRANAAMREELGNLASDTMNSLTTKRTKKSRRRGGK